MKIINKEIDTSIYPHLLVNGTTGSGKTSFIKHIIKDNICNYKIAYFSPKPNQLEEFKGKINIFREENELKQVLDKLDSWKISNTILIIDELIYYLTIYKWLYNRLLKIAVIGRENNNQLILITQRASYKVFTGELKANVHNIICLRTLYKIDSRMILNMPNAINLKPGEFYFKRENMIAKGAFTKEIGHIPNNSNKIIKRIKNHIIYERNKVINASN